MHCELGFPPSAGVHFVLFSSHTFQIVYRGEEEVEESRWKSQTEFMWIFRFEHYIFLLRWKHAAFLRIPNGNHISPLFQQFFFDLSASICFLLHLPSFPCSYSYQSMDVSLTDVRCQNRFALNIFRLLFFSTLVVSLYRVNVLISLFFFVFFCMNHRHTRCCLGYG